MVKEYWKSKTVWFNVIVVALIIAHFLGVDVDLPGASSKADQIALWIAPFVNLILRVLTDKKIGLKAGE